jgi:hypothetical protein
MSDQFESVGQKRNFNHNEASGEERKPAIEEDVKLKALGRMVGFLQFERDPCLDGGTECETENVGALLWKKYDNTTIGCGITAVMELIKENTLRDYNDTQREWTISEHCGLHVFPKRLQEIADMLRSASLEAENAGFLDFPFNDDYKPKNEWLPTPNTKNDTMSQEMCKLADLLNIGRFVNDDQGEDIIGNLAWVDNGKTVLCPISAVLDLIEKDLLNEDESEDHLQFLEDYDSLSVFPIRLRELAQQLEAAATAAIDLNFQTIPDEEEDCSENDEDDEDEEDKEDDEDDEDEKDEEDDEDEEDEDE